MINIKKAVAARLGELVPQLTADKLYGMLEYPPNDDMGDIAFPCFKLSKVLHKAPVAIANALLEGFGKLDCIESVSVISGYLNFKINTASLAKRVFEVSKDKGDAFGSENIGEGRTIVVDYSAPNIAKPFHVGHLRSTAIGNAIYKIYKFMGYDCFGINYLGDWGTQFGKVITAYHKWGSKEEVEKGGIPYLNQLYVRFHTEADLDPSLNDEARDWFRKMETGDREALELWKWFRDISLKGYEETYKLLNVTFDSYNGEAFYNDKMEPVIEEIKSKGLTKESDGATIVDLEAYNMPPCLILKRDGSTLYATRDITAALYRKNTYHFDKAIYVTGVSQALHFAQWIKVVELMGYPWAKDIIHVPFGTVSIGGEKLATRTGNVILLEDLLSEAIKKTLEIINTKNPDMPNKEEVAKQVGVGAVIFGDLSSNRIKDISFTWEEMLNFDGETGPYVQYTHARICSVLKRAEGWTGSKDIDTALLGSIEEKRVIKLLSQFTERLMSAMDDLEPSVLSRYLIDLCQEFNRFYREHNILKSEDAVKDARLALIDVVRGVLATGLHLLGIASPESI